MLKCCFYYFEELVFKFSFGKNEGADNPPWNESEDFLPLSPRVAIAVSRLALLDMLRAYPNAEPKFHSCALKSQRF